MLLRWIRVDPRGSAQEPLTTRWQKDEIRGPVQESWWSLASRRKRGECQHREAGGHCRLPGNFSSHR